MSILYKNLAVTEDDQTTKKEPDVNQVFIKDLELNMSIGVTEDEKKKKQYVLVNITMDIESNPAWRKDRLDDVVCYDGIIKSIKGLAAVQHVNMVETFAEQVAILCLDDPRVQKVRIKVEKPEVYSFTESVGAEITRSR